MHNKQHLAALIAMGPALVLNTLRRADEVRATDDLKLPAEGAKAAGIAPRELEMAKKLIEDMSESFDPAQYHDTFHDDVLALVDKKIRAGKTAEIDETEAPAKPARSADILDLSELLKRSLGKNKGRAASGGRKSGNDGDDDDTAAPAHKTPKRRRATG
jgi:DNA end-binding protein Ku